MRLINCREYSHEVRKVKAGFGLALPCSTGLALEQGFDRIRTVKSKKLFLLVVLTILSFGNPIRAQDQTPNSDSSTRFQIPANDDGLPGQGPIRRYDWFRRLWTERRSKWATRQEQD